MTANRIARGVLAYASFFWAISWRSLVLAVFMAICLGVGLGVITGMGLLHEDATVDITNIVAAPMTLAVVIGVIVIQLRARLL